MPARRRELIGTHGRTQPAIARHRGQPSPGLAARLAPARSDRRGDSGQRRCAWCLRNAGAIPRWSGSRRAPTPCWCEVEPRLEDAFIDILGGGPGGDSVLAEHMPQADACRPMSISMP